MGMVASICPGTIHILCNAKIAIFKPTCAHAPRGHNGENVYFLFTQIEKTIHFNGRPLIQVWNMVHNVKHPYYDHIACYWTFFPTSRSEEVEVLNSPHDLKWNSSYSPGVCRSSSHWRSAYV